MSHLTPNIAIKDALASHRGLIVSLKAAEHKIRAIRSL
jgi:hypothetical protein